MINLYTLDAKSFKIEDSILVRTFDAYIDRQGHLILRDIHSDSRVYLGNITEVKINGVASTLQTVKQTVFNYSCSCGVNTSPKYKIFDYTFDKTFA